MKIKQGNVNEQKRAMHKLIMPQLMFNTANPMNREQRRQAERHNRKAKK